MAGSLWNHVLDELKQTMNPQTFDTWFANSTLISSSKERLIIEFVDKRVKEVIEQKYLGKISDIIYDLSGRYVKIDLICPEDSQKKQQINGINQEISVNKDGLVELPRPKLNSRFDFDHFVVGPNNEIAYASSLSVAENPGSQFNPLFIWGGTGLGKTHLLQAISKKIITEKNYLKVLYVQSEQFINEIISAIRRGDTSHFKLKYRNVDVLLIDDIQFIEAKDQTQIEFFHTFNALHEAGSQIVISSDRPPKNLTYLTDRIRTRFEWGMITRISPPDLETRVAILKNKAQESKIDIDDDTYYFIAKNITSNIRALEGALNTLKFSGKRITKDIAASLLADFISKEDRPEILSIAEIKKVICHHFNISAEEIISKSRAARLVIPRFIAIYFASKYTNLTSKEIGNHFGGRDHSTIINARQEIEKKIKTDQELKASILELEQRLSS